MFGSFVSYLILGIPVAIYMGVLTMLLLLFTATISILNKRKIRVIPMKWHSRMAYVTIAAGLAHGSVILLALLGL